MARIWLVMLDTVPYVTVAPHDSVSLVCFGQSEDCALVVLELPLRCCSQWTALDLIGMSEVDKV